MKKGEIQLEAIYLTQYCLTPKYSLKLSLCSCRKPESELRMSQSVYLWEQGHDRNI